jgi:hypothetical protein
VTIIPERRSDIDVIALFLAGVALFAAWRAFSNQPVASAVMVAFAAVILGGWIYLRMTPNWALTIGPDEIVYGQPNKRKTVITRGTTDRVLIEYAGEEGWLLVADDPAGTWTSLIGFDPGAIANACEAQGWPVTVNPPITR